MSVKALISSCLFLLASLSYLVDADNGFSRDPKKLELLVLTVATEETDGYTRFMRSCSHYDVPVRVIGMNTSWKGGNVRTDPGGAHKINLLKDAVAEYKDKKNLVLMFSDSYDAIFLARAEAFIKKFLEFKAHVVFSAEGFCWPDRWLVDKYPEVGHGKRYLCSGGFIGYAPVFHQIINEKPVKDEDDDQLFYTNIYLDKEKRDKFNMKLDHKAEIFMNLNGAEEEVQLKFEGEKVWLYNKVYSTTPLWVHGNGPSKVHLNYIGNYLPAMWNKEKGCLVCNEDTIKLPEKESDYPKVMMAIFISRPTPFVPEFFKRIEALDYPKKKIALYIHNLMDGHTKEVNEWLTEEIRGLYHSVTYQGPGTFEAAARNKAVDVAIQSGSDYLFVVDANVVYTNKKSLKLLIEQNRPLLVPKMSKHAKLWSNFWGTIGDDGYYARAEDYIDIVEYRRVGIWNSAYVTGSYLIQKDVLPKLKHAYSYGNLEPDLSFSKYLRDNGIFMYVTNMHYFGRLKETDTVTTNHLHNDLWQIFDNQIDWEERYLHPNYSQNLNKSIPLKMPCNDVFWFPLMSETWATHMIEEMEHYGKWSGGKHEDARLNGGYENVPTVDIHMNQVGWEREWLHLLKTYIVPVNTRIFPGYYSEGRAIMNFVVKYTPSGQYYLRPHHDSSTYTINIGLNKPGIHYGGGGSRFIRQDCAVTDTQVGWALMHPGRLTHYHEGLPTTWGTRYIMVCFVDP
ncbi:multifunctional procollagen lysine hydroxylase and glycosyltransferase LH3 isoform X2 [Nematostella vectensis]|uniref:multifunctional procollagen lysine hydroxylase and glycosyltransferase LH3 isoform X2 n=1 Tax=Nematostella vectensis TaxID=45351 RepID=UPI0020777AC1|nr:multifunctional procollagen lysine hydroxylase and glycosyltransferase LH3 isoform X2 [Nematostella vectensis]